MLEMPELEIPDSPREKFARLSLNGCTDDVSHSNLNGLNRRLTGSILLLLIAALLIISYSHFKPRDAPAGLSIHRSAEIKSKNHDHIKKSARNLMGKGVMLANVTDGQDVSNFRCKDLLHMNIIIDFRRPNALSLKNGKFTM